ncbi:phasin family protein [Desertibaculum subflavum]|uniref:phasin family protein n=1 Tax=Desertibaculum subflavum TaxID=2268458 RepID=UPI0013C3EC9C
MAANGSAFPNFDPTKMFKDLPMSGGFDMEKLSQMHARNVEAMQTANQLATDGFQTVARRQAEIMKDAMEQFSGAMKDMMSANGTDKSGTKQAEIAKQMMEKAVGNVRELTELATKAQSEAFDVLTKRWMASLEEARDVFAKRG